MNIVEFPGLGLKFNIDPIAIHLPTPTGGIRWYALLILTGIIVACIVGFREYKRLGGDIDHVYNMLLYCIPISIICARIYYVLFTFKEYDSFWDMLKIWEGGIAIYGAVIGAAAVVIIYCKRHKLSIPLHLDLAAIGFMLGQMIGRWGNFVNGEAYGRPTDLPWRMVVNGVCAHPTFLYESLWLLIGFLLIYFNRKKNYFEGKTACLYLIWYGTGRAFIETLRTDSLMLGPVRVSSLLSVLLVIFAIVAFFKLKYRNIKNI
ncbi:MAG: prolipoprotein diacylglyceryl transferase [Clostridia bacterium]|nr:prolipoprotein diacylglyceryl transferase [Clostridia bacterium]